MIDILNRFLFQHKSISIPGLGTIHAERVPAKMDAANNRIVAPSFRFKFDKYFDAPDKTFFTYLSVQKKIPDFEAMRLYNQFAQDFRNGIMAEDKLQWDEIGYFRKNHAGEIEFVQTGYQEIESFELPVVIPPTALPAHSGYEKPTSGYIHIPDNPETPVVQADPQPITVEEPVADDISVEYPQEILERRSFYNLERVLFYIAAGLFLLSLIAAGVLFSKYGFNAKAWSNRTPLSASKPYSE